MTKTLHEVLNEDIRGLSKSPITDDFKTRKMRGELKTHANRVLNTLLGDFEIMSNKLTTFKQLSQMKKEFEKIADEMEKKLQNKVNSLEGKQ